jgi:carbonic anhydrase/acetyltransferase-like protein (isoleucine patch superfamily)
MPNIIEVRGKRPLIDSSVWIADDVVVTGDVRVGARSSIWFKSIIRGDVCSIEIGEETNVQDAVIIHGTYQKSNTFIGSRVSIGHRAIIHGCTIHDDVLVGMGAIIMDDAILESNIIVAAGAVVTSGSVLSSGGIYAGVPAVKIKEPGIEKIAEIVGKGAQNYLMYTGWYRT